MTDQKKPTKSAASEQAFTVDTQSGVVHEMPSISRLLNRKTLVALRNSAAAAKAPKRRGTRSLFIEPKPVTPDSSTLPNPEQNPAETPALEPSSPLLVAGRPGTMPTPFRVTETQPPAMNTPTPPAPPASEAGGEVPTSLTQTAAQASAQTLAQPGSPSSGGPALLAVWQESRLAQTRDPLGTALTQSLGIGLESAVFLAIRPAPEGSPVPHFAATACLRPAHRLQLWSGLKWNPLVLPQLWNEFIQAGCIEFPPPGTQTSIQSNRNVLRAAFGIHAAEWLTLVRVGPAAACRGALLLVSSSSLVQAGLTAQLTTYHSPAPARTQKAA